MSQQLKVGEGYSMPPHRPYYPVLPTHYMGVRMQTVFFRADVEHIRTIVPEPLEPAPDGVCVAFALDVPFSSDYGPFQESGLQVGVTFRGEKGFYCSHVFLNNVRAITSGRERWGTPKEYADVTLRQYENVLLSTTVLDGIEAMILRSELGKPAAPEDVPAVFPSYRLKIIPRVDGPGFAIKQLITVGPEDAETHLLYKGDGQVSFHPACSDDLKGLAPLESMGAFYQEASFSESYGQVVLDYSKIDG